MSDHKSNRATRRHNSAAKYARRLAINIQVQPEAVAEKPYQFKDHARTCSCHQCAHNRRRFCGNSLEGLSRQERRHNDSAAEQQQIIPHIPCGLPTPHQPSSFYYLVF